MVREEMKKWTDDLSFRLSFAETNEEKMSRNKKCRHHFRIRVIYRN